MRKNDKSIVRDNISFIFDAARNKSHQETLEQITARVWNSDSYKHLPRYEKTYFQGMIDAKWRALESELVPFVTLRGALIRSSNVPDGQWEHTSAGGLYWIDTMTKYYNY